MKRKSAARRAAELLRQGASLGSENDECAADLLREDRERVRMKRAILAWRNAFRGDSKRFALPENKTLAEVADSLSKHKSERGT